MNNIEVLTKILELQEEISEAQIEISTAFGIYVTAHKKAWQRLNLASTKIAALAATARDLSSNHPIHEAELGRDE